LAMILFFCSPNSAEPQLSSLWTKKTTSAIGPGRWWRWNQFSKSYSR